MQTSAITPGAGPSSLPQERRKQAPHALTKFTLYENKTRLYVVASNAGDTRHRLLRVDRTLPDQHELKAVDDGTAYTGKQLRGVLKMLEEGNRAGGGLGRTRSFFGIAGQYPHLFANRIWVLRSIKQVSFASPRGGTWLSLPNALRLHCWAATMSTTANMWT